MRRNYFALSLLLALSGASCAMFQRPSAPTYTPPVIHVAPAPTMPQFNFRPGADGTACLSFENYIKFEERDAKVWARLQYLHTLLVLQGAVFDPPALPQAAVPTP